MPLGIKKYLQVPASILPEEDSSTPRAHLTSYSDINSIGGFNHYLDFITVGSKA